MVSGMKVLRGAAALAALIAVSGAPAGAQYNENGYGPDPDRDTNPATRTRAVANIGATDINLDPRFSVLTFEPPPGAHGRHIRDQYWKADAGKNGVRFGEGLEWQHCSDQPYQNRNSLCTYIRPASGSFAAYYRDDWREPLKVEFDRPICAAMLSVYPTGGKEGEVFKVTLRGRDESGRSIGKATVKFGWTQDAFRWRVMAGGFFLKESTRNIEVMVRRAKGGGDIVQFLIDDLAYLEKDCDTVLEEIRDVAGFMVDDDGDIVDSSAQGPDGDDADETAPD